MPNQDPIYRFKPSVLEVTITMLVEDLRELESCVLVDDVKCSQIKKEIKNTLIQLLLRQNLFLRNIIEYCKEFLVVEDLEKIKSHEYNYNKLTLILT